MMIASPKVKKRSARARVDALPLDGASIRGIVRPVFRRRNDYNASALGELPAELRRFGIVTTKDLRLLMKKHRRTLVIDQNVRMSRAETLYLAQEAGFPGVDTFSGTCWLSLAGLVRSAMELEFGETAAIYVAESRA